MFDNLCSQVAILHDFPTLAIQENANTWPFTIHIWVDALNNLERLSFTCYCSFHMLLIKKLMTMFAALCHRICSKFFQNTDSHHPTILQKHISYHWLLKIKFNLLGKYKVHVRMQFLKNHQNEVTLLYVVWNVERYWTTSTITTIWIPTDWFVWINE